MVFIFVTNTKDFYVKDLFQIPFTVVSCQWRAVM